MSWTIVIRQYSLYSLLPSGYTTPSFSGYLSGLAVNGLYCNVGGNLALVSLEDYRGGNGAKWVWISSKAQKYEILNFQGLCSLHSSGMDGTDIWMDGMPLYIYRCSHFRKHHDFWQTLKSDVQSWNSGPNFGLRVFFINFQTISHLPLRMFF